MKLILTVSVLFGLLTLIAGAHLRDLATVEAGDGDGELDMIEEEEDEIFDNLRRELGTLDVNEDNCEKWGGSCECTANMDWAALGYIPKLILKNTCKEKRKLYVKYYKYKDEDEIKGPIKSSKVVEGGDSWDRVDGNKLGVDCVKVKHCSVSDPHKCTSWKKYSCGSSGSTCAAFHFTYKIKC